MKLNKFAVEYYKWTPFWLLALLSCLIVFENGLSFVGLMAIFVCVIYMIPFIHWHSVICRHIYTECKKGREYEL